MSCVFADDCDNPLQVPVSQIYEMLHTSCSRSGWACWGNNQTHIPEPQEQGSERLNDRGRNERAGACSFDLGKRNDISEAEEVTWPQARTPDMPSPVLCNFGTWAHGTSHVVTADLADSRLPCATPRLGAAAAGATSLALCRPEPGGTGGDVRRYFEM